MASEIPPEQPAAGAFGPVAPFYDALMAGVPYDYWADYIEQLFERHGIRPDKLLDIGCGTGAVTIEMAARGYRCVGLDLSKEMLACARANTSRQALAIEYVCQDAAAMSLPGMQFDAAISLFDSLNNLTDSARLLAAFERVRRHLSTPGIFLFDLNTDYAFRCGLFNQRSTPADGPLQYVWRSRYDKESRICTIDMSFRYELPGEPARTFQETHRQRAYGKDEIASMLAEAGFDPVWCYDAYTFKAPRSRSDRLFFVAGHALTARPVYANRMLAVRRDRGAREEA